MHEQLQQNDWFCRIGTLCNLLSKFDKTYALKVETDPNHALSTNSQLKFSGMTLDVDRKSQKDVVTAEQFRRWRHCHYLNNHGLILQ